MRIAIFSRPAALMAVVLFIFLSGKADAQQLDNLKSQQPFKLSGSLGANLMMYNASGIESRMQPFSYVLSANATASVYGISLPFSFTWSDRQKNYSQPFNQFGMSPTYKWATVHLGYRNVTFSNFTLAGHTFFGAGAELNPGKFRFGMVYGRFKKSTEGYTLAYDSLPDFSRKGLAVKIGLGTAKNFVDLIFLNIRDDSTSSPQLVVNPLNTAAQNLVAGLNTRFALSKKLNFETEIAASLYTTDVKASGLGNFEDISLLKKLNKTMKINQSTEFYTAIRSALNYKTKGFSTKLEYRRIDPKYKSMGAYFFNNDIENLTLAPSFSLLKRKLMLRGSIGLQRDNLRNTKKATSLRTISSLNASYNPSSKFGVDANYSNYSNNQRASRVPLIDSLKQFMTTKNLSIAPRLMFANTNRSHMVMLIFNRMSLNDKNPLSANLAETNATMFNLNYSLNLAKAMLSFSAGLNHTILENFIATNKATGFSIGVSKSLNEGRFTAGLNNSLQHTEYLQSKGWLFNSSFMSSWRFYKHHALRLGFYYTNVSYPDGSVNPSFKEFKGDLSYVYTF